jgi:ISXO2-like transposase domain/Transposase zinc-ribbon domain
MNLLDFGERFPDENACRVYLRSKREADGIVCKSCGCKKHYWIDSKSLWRCASCRSSINLRSGTIMEKSHVPVKTWFMCIHLMTSTKKAFSALEMQRQLGMKRYEPVWYMMQKIRLSMGKRDSKHKLHGNIEVDDAYFEIVDLPEVDELGNKKDDDDDLKRGRGSKRQQQVLIMVESNPNPDQDKPYKKKRSIGFVKMVIMDNLKNDSINYEVSKAIDKRSTLLTDGMAGFSKLNEVVKNHHYLIIPKKEAGKTLPWVHTVIANAKRLFLGIHHSVGRPYLQNYLNEYCYKLNRRNFNSDLFDRMIVAGANDTWY